MTLDVNTDAGSHLDRAVVSDDDTEILARRRALGAYYTPDRLSAIVASWAIQSSNDRVLEPGFGGCGFLVASKLRLEALGQSRPHDFIHGCDVDEAAFRHLKQVFNAEPSAQHFPEIDFLETHAGQTWGGLRFNVALGNPPYVSYQALGDKRLQYKAALQQSAWPDMSSRASLWAYFVLHALSFLEQGGRVAWVLPGSLIRADYSRYVKDAFRSSFKKAAFFRVHERLFTPAGASEETVVLIAEGYGEGSGCQLEEHAVETTEDLSEALGRWRNRSAASQIEAELTIANVLDGLNALPTIALGELLSARIGLVTGDNKFFLFTEQRAEAEGIDLDVLCPVFAKGAMAPGLNFGKREVNAARNAGRACFLLSCNDLGEAPPEVVRYLEAYPKERIANVSTYRKRRLWHETTQANVPDAFWPVMRDLGPKLVLNPQKLHCTNTIHRVFFKSTVTGLLKKAIAICLQSSYAQLHAELCGRSYGSGVLKHEPRDVEKIRIPWPKEPDPAHVTRTFTLIDTALRQGKNTKAMQIADSFVSAYTEASYNQRETDLIRSKLNSVRRARMPISARLAAHFD